MFNIKTNKDTLYKYNITDYYNNNNEFIRYLWKSALGLLRLLKDFERGKVKKEDI